MPDIDKFLLSNHNLPPKKGSFRYAKVTVTKMHEQLYISPKSPLRYFLFITGLALFPFAFLDLTVRNGKTELLFFFDFALLAASVGLSVLYFLPFEKKTSCLNIPYFSVLVCEFLRFGSVTLFSNEISFEYYISHVAFMLSSVAVLFFVYFIGEGKIRSKLPLIFISCIAILITVLSVIIGFPPFAAYSEINEGAWCIGISRPIAFMIYNLSPLFIAIFLKNDKVKQEQEQKNNP